MTASAEGSKDPRIVFLTRDPIVHQRGGSTTYVMGLLDLLRARGANVTLVATVAYSRSPRLFFKPIADVPEGVRLRYPGYLRVGGWYVLPFRPKAWARTVSRMAVGRAWLRPLSGVLETIYGASMFAGAWDLTTPTEAECRVAVREIEADGATAVVANYCIWGPLFSADRLGSLKTAILMHDLLSARTERFRANGMPLDSPPFGEAEEMQWLSSAGAVLAAQEGEAEAIRSRVSAQVVVTPVLLRPRALGEDKVEAGRCLFVGSNIPPNRAGLQFLLGSVWPLVRAAVPGAKLGVAGTVSAALGDEVEAVGVERLGVVPSLEAEYARAAVCLVPLLVGSGIKIKLLEALSFGKAIVSTPTGVQGLEAWAGEAIEIAEGAEEFGAAVVRLLTDTAERKRRETEALRAAREQFGPGRALDPAFVKALL